VQNQAVTNASKTRVQEYNYISFTNILTVWCFLFKSRH